jgi:exodeoxyribonuclease-5
MFEYEVEAEKINKFDLTEEQEEAITEVFDIYEGGDNYAQISGAAGTGKTTLALELIDRARGDGYMCHLTAPTNKAAKILSEKTGRRAVTIHELLQLVLENVEDTQKLSTGSPLKFEDGDMVLIIIDEASMVSRELLELINKSVEANSDVKILFLGDPYQLNPIGEDISLALNFPGFELKTVMRQAAENPIIQLAHEIRLAQGDDRSIDWYKFIDGENIIVHDKTKAFLNSYIEDFKNGINTHLVAWRNVKVNDMNKYVRNEIYGAELAKQPFLVGEEVMLYCPAFKMGPSGKLITVLQNSSLANVISIEQTTRSVAQNLFECWDIWIQSDDLTIEPVQVFVPVDMDEYNKDLQAVADKAKRLQGKERSFIFHEYYYPIKNFFTQMRPSHAITSHKSQGSTFTSVYVNVHDIQLNRTRIEMLRSLYVAVTRGAVKLHLYGCGRKR